jgi:D-3-phosphoglycerate dehydrogenase
MSGQDRATRQRVLVAEPIAAGGIRMLEEAPGLEVVQRFDLTPSGLSAALREHEALIVRSKSRVTAELLADPGRLRVIGRAGTGVDNIDLDAATRAGVVVLNSPGGNAVAAAELTMAMLLALARHLPQANASLRDGRWERGRFLGVEVEGKTLGLVGIGRVGREVARRALAFRMKVLASDPHVTRQGIEDLGIEPVTLPDLLSRADFVSLHAPLATGTRHLLGGAEIGAMKPGAFLVNCARGGLVDESALLAALEAGRLGGAALDVFEEEPPSRAGLVSHPRVVSTPHLGASTVEAQERVGEDIAAKIRDYLCSGTILDAVNFPSMSREEGAAVRPIMDLAERLGRFLGQVAVGGVRRLELRCYGDFNRQSLRPLAMAAAKGVLAPVLAEAVSYVNALGVAAERGITVEEARSHEATPFAGLLRLTVDTDAGRSTVAGTLYTAEHPRLVEVDGVAVDCSPRGSILYFRNRDVPGVVGRIGTILGKAGVNIASLQLGRGAGDGMAVSLVGVDTPLPAATLAEIAALPDLTAVRQLRFPD